MFGWELHAGFYNDTVNGVAHPNAHLYCRLIGNFGADPATNQEKWSAGFRGGIIGADVPYDATKLQTLANSLFAAARVFHLTSESLTSPYCWLTNVTVARVGTDGKYLPSVQDTTFSTGTAALGIGNPSLPWNTAGVFSLRTGRPRGHASNGRLYYPLLAGGASLANGRLTGTQVDARLGKAKTMLDAFNTAFQAYQVNTFLVVSSGVGGIASKVTSVRSDERLDSIERRENAGATVWHTQTIA